MRRQMIRVCGLLLSGCMLCSCSILPTEEEFDAAPVVREYEGNDYNKYTLVRGDMVQKETITVTYQGTNRLETTGEGTGYRIKKVAVKKGQKVEVGDVLVQNYLAEQERTIKSSERQIESLELQIRQAKQMREQELKKLDKLGGSKKQKDNIRSQYDSQIKNCQSSLKLARLDLQSAKEEIQENNVTSDIDGTVTKVDHSFDGGYATEDDVLVVVQGKKRNRFRAKTPYASQFKKGQEVIITVGGQQYRAKAEKSWEKNLIYFYPGSELSLKNGASGILELILKEKKDVLYLPASLVYDMGGKKVVYVEDENGVKTIREVTVGEQIDNLVEITDGLQENEQVITN
ncbi:MAG: hypothetical protein J1F02_00795 [Lachnospiraceae bacterium]|nr:hypothetical protein [Lachnospiraceae bacterium]